MKAMEMPPETQIGDTKASISLPSWGFGVWGRLERLSDDLPSLAKTEKEDIHTHKHTMLLFLLFLQPPSTFLRLTVLACKMRVTIE
jgi:hypothetical protein